MTTFKQLLYEKFASQNDLAKEINVSKQLVSRWIIGKNQPRLEEVLKLSKALNVSTETIIKCFVKEVWHGEKTHC